MNPANRTLLFSVLCLNACGLSGEPVSWVNGGPPAGSVTVSLETAEPLTRVDERFLSVAVDISQVVGGHWWAKDAVVEAGVGAGLVEPYDFSRPRLRKMAAELAPAFLRVGGSEADVTWYDLSDSPVTEPPHPFEFVLNRTLFNGLNTFAWDLGFDVAFCLNAGPGPRAEDGLWTPDNARELLAYAAQQELPVRQWELGNEINGFPVIHGLDFVVSGVEYAADMAVARALVDESAPSADLSGPSSAFWPVIGEMMPVMPSFLAEGGDLVDLITFHYYPQQSRRCPVASRRAGPFVMMEPDNLDEILTWLDGIEALRDVHAPATPIWLGETGNAQCGGEPGVSDRFVGGFWWLDQLGLMARRSVQVVVRQTLSGSNYGIIDDETLEPRPDYWNSLLWKRLMGSVVLDVEVAKESPKVRAYAHCTRDSNPGSVTVLAINLDRDVSVTVAFESVPSGRGDVYAVTATELQGTELLLNGMALETAADGTPPPIQPERRGWKQTPFLELGPASYAFTVFPDAGAAGCL